MAIKLVKLITDDDLIGDVTVQGAGEIKIAKPVRVGMSHQGIGMGPFNPLGKTEDVTLRTEHVMFICDPMDELKNAYNEKFGSGLVIPPSGLVI